MQRLLRRRKSNRVWLLFFMQISLFNSSHTINSWRRAIFKGSCSQASELFGVLENVYWSDESICAAKRDRSYTKSLLRSVRSRIETFSRGWHATCYRHLFVITILGGHSRLEERLGKARSDETQSIRRLYALLTVESCERRHSLHMSRSVCTPACLSATMSR